MPLSNLHSNCVCFNPARAHELLGEAMHVVMLGHAASGKTTFLAAMSEALRKPIGGFRLQAEKGALRERLARHVKRIQKGRYPDPTRRSELHVFRLTYCGETVCSVTLTDYNGSTLNCEEQLEDLRKLVDGIARADGVLMLLDGQNLPKDRTDRVGLGRLMLLMSRAFAAMDAPKPLTVVLTKWDLRQEAPPEPKVGFFQRFWLAFRGLPEPRLVTEGIGQAHSDPCVATALKGLFSVVRANSLVKGAVVPVACKRGTIMNVHAAMLHTILICLEASRVKLNARRDSCVAQARWREVKHIDKQIEELSNPILRLREQLTAQVSFDVGVQPS